MRDVELLDSRARNEVYFALKSRATLMEDLGMTDQAKYIHRLVHAVTTCDLAIVPWRAPRETGDHGTQATARGRDPSQA